ncbi:MAG: DUF6262 family protein [Desulfitobacteriaceae bacterium]|nr:DUF6262 family protein [Desulfitobacteriaceae bacterium]
MGDKKKLPMSLAEKQELQRQETINKVLRACADIQAEDGKVTISTLVKYTGLARSTFSKPHIRELLTEYGYASGDGTAAVTKRKKAKQNDIIAEKDRQIAELRAKNVDLEKECELLRSRLFLAIQRL